LKLLVWIEIGLLTLLSTKVYFLDTHHHPQSTALIREATAQNSSSEGRKQVWRKEETEHFGIVLDYEH